MTLYEQALEAINRVHADTSVAPEETRRSLVALRDEIDIMIDALDQDALAKGGNHEGG